jgi:hypothetical protein
MAVVTAQPDLVGRYFVGSEPIFLPLSVREMSRAAEFLGTVIDTFGITPRRSILLVCLFEEAAQFVPIEEALMERGIILTNAEASIYDGGRAESVLRRFDVAAVLGLNGALLDSMLALDIDVEKALAGKIVWARPDAYDRLTSMTGFSLRRYLEVGPTVGLECVAGAGAHVDAREFSYDDEGGEIRVSSRLLRVLPLDQAPTGVKGRVDHGVCTCGVADPRVIV